MPYKRPQFCKGSGLLQNHSSVYLPPELLSGLCSQTRGWGQGGRGAGGGEGGGVGGKQLSVFALLRHF